MIYETIFFGILILIFSIMDWKHKAIPSVFLTGSIFIALALNLGNLPFGALALVFALLLKEFDYFKGVADIKLTVLMGLMISSFIDISIFFVLIVFFGLVYKFVVKWRFKDKTEWAFIPVFFFIYLTLAILQMI